ncbi:unnamed protein product, partial [Ilex paraguariensis]
WWWDGGRIEERGVGGEGNGGGDSVAKEAEVGVGDCHQEEKVEREVVCHYREIERLVDFLKILSG